MTRIDDLPGCQPNVNQATVSHQEETVHHASDKRQHRHPGKPPSKTTEIAAASPRCLFLPSEMVQPTGSKWGTTQTPTPKLTPLVSTNSSTTQRSKKRKRGVETKRLDGRFDVGSGVFTRVGTRAEYDLLISHLVRRFYP